MKTKEILSKAKDICLILMLIPFIILAGVIFGEKCDDIYE